MRIVLVFVLCLFLCGCILNANGASDSELNFDFSSIPTSYNGITRISKEHHERAKQMLGNALRTTNVESRDARVNEQYNRANEQRGFGVANDMHGTHAAKVASATAGVAAGGSLSSLFSQFDFWDTIASGKQHMEQIIRDMHKNGASKDDLDFLFWYLNALKQYKAQH